MRAFAGDRAAVRAATVAHALQRMTLLLQSESHATTASGSH
jgi:hypothetical protein